jgi:hypothetical protein
MGALSRSSDGWRNHIHMQCRNSGPGGSLAVMMHQELQNITDGNRELAALQSRGFADLQHGIGHLSDATEHLAWVQQRAHEAQMNAQYRVMQLQREANDELRDISASQHRQNSLLVECNSHLEGIAEILRSVRDTQDEHHKAVKAERVLKEVLFQLTTMLEEMILPDDEVSRLALCKVALDQLDERGLNTAHLSDLEDKRAFASFVKSTRKVVRDTQEEFQADLLAFEIWHKGYRDTCRLGVAPFSKSKAPVWVPSDAPLWQDRPEPDLQLRELPSAPVEVATPMAQPETPCFATTKTADGADYKCYEIKTIKEGDWENSIPEFETIPLNPDNGLRITPDNVPTKEGTKRRFPKESGFKTFFRLGAEDWENARQYEKALRLWAAQVKAYDAYTQQLAEWQGHIVALQEENSRIQAVLHPKKVEQFRIEELERRSKFEEQCRAHKSSEEQRRSQWEEAVRNHEAKEKGRYHAWLGEWNDFETKFRDQGKRLNDFLDEHPDLQLLYVKVHTEQDLASIKTRAFSEGHSRPLAEPVADEEMPDWDGAGPCPKCGTIINMQFSKAACPICGHAMSWDEAFQACGSYSGTLPRHVRSERELEATDAAED